MRIFYVPTRATRDTEIIRRMVTFDAAFDLSDLASFTASQFAPKALKESYDGLRTHETYQSFANTLHSRLGIGANGDGDKAMRLLVRIQSGHQISTVDELYKDMVLERPTTFAAADQAIEHFDSLEAAYVSMKTEETKASLLDPIIGHHETLTTAQQEIVALDAFGLKRPGTTPMSLWTLQTESRILDEAIRRNSEDRRTTGEDLRTAIAEERRVSTALATATEAHRAAGGESLERLAAEITAGRAETDARRDRLNRLTGQISALGETIDTRDDFERLTNAANAFLDTLAEQRARIKQARDDVSQARWPLSDRIRTLRNDLKSHTNRAGRIPPHLDALRRDAADALGVPHDALPFIGELIDVLPEHTSWRTAIETVLGSEALVMLVPEHRLTDLSKALDPLMFGARLRYHGARTDLASTPDLSDPHRIAGKLSYKESPFAGWIAAHVSGPAFNALCVHSPAELDGPGHRVTAAGQTRRGKRGAHGRDSRQKYVIGFSNTDLLADIEAEIADITSDLVRADAEVNRHDAARDELEARKSAYEALDGARWDDYDVTGARDRVAGLERTRDDILAANNELNKLSAIIDELNAHLEQARKLRFGLDKRAEDLNNQHAEYVDRQDAVNTDLFAIEDEGQVTLDLAQVARLDEAFVAAVGPGDRSSLKDFRANLQRLHSRLAENYERAQHAADRATTDLENIFVRYQKEWEDPNIGRTVAAYPDYANILAEIMSAGLYERHAEWRRRLTEWSGQDLVPLNGAMERAIADIEDRLYPINDILARLPFGANGDRLNIRLRTLTPEHVTTFRRQLKTLSTSATGELTEERLGRLFTDLQDFMAKIRRRDDVRATETSDRDRLLDVRRHVEITAVKLSPEGDYLSTYAGLGGKSGGESQELVAFIVGAALRFRLGDEGRPRFAPVFLDEGFVKSDAEFAGRAVGAWQGLGFQLIVGAPLDKVTSLEPHMDQILGITKSSTTHYSFVSAITDANELALEVPDEAA